jgi:nucleotide-binding universal stress UspA family protein
MDNKARTILVLWDFTDKCEYAFAYAVNVSNILDMDISILHIVKSDNEIEPMQTKMFEVAEKLYENYKKKPKIVVLKGNIFKTISNYASEGNTELVIMGTHGIRGLQKITGSWALKVIRGSRVPFMVVHKMPETTKMDNIVFPIDFKKENKEKIKWAHYLCNIYKSKIHIVHPIVSDHTFKRKIYSNIVFTKKYFENTNIKFEIKAIGTKIDFAKETIEYAESINANVILIMTSKAITFADYVMGPSEQYIIANEAKIPVMVVNPKPKIFVGGFSASGS